MPPGERQHYRHHGKPFMGLSTSVYVGYRLAVDVLALRWLRRSKSTLLPGALPQHTGRQTCSVLSVKDLWKPVLRGQRCGRAPLGRSLLDHLSPGQAPGLLHTDTDRYYSTGTLSTMDDLQAQWDPEQQRGDPPTAEGTL
ncbi:unnamed protein product [Boreogadus saida]